jgi:two-component system, cell cycle sensor histidine kinase and response regulator CckA
MVLRKGQTILVVEDDPGVAGLERRRLDRAGYDVLTAATADAALELLHRHEVHLILLDYRLPGDIDGLSFFAQVKQAGFDVPVILVTGFGSEATVIQALRVGVRDFVTKSVEYLEYLPEAVERVLKQVQTEHQLAESEARLASIINSAKDAILLVDAEQRITLFNAAAEQMFRCPAEQALGKWILDFIPYQERDALSADSAQASGPLVESLTQHVQKGSRGVRADGDVFPLESTIARVNVGGRNCHTIVVRDLTERLSAQEAVRASETLYRNLVETTPDAIVVVDLNATIIKVNRQALETFGYDQPQAILGKNVLDLTAPEDHFLAVECLQKLLVCRSLRNIELTLLRKDGLRFPAETNSAVVLDGEGQAQGYLIVVRDITERKQVSAALLKEQEFTRAVLDHIATGVIACGPDGILSLFNRAARDMHGHLEEPLPPEEWAPHYNLYLPDGKTLMRKEEVPLYRAFQGEVLKNVELMIAPANAPARTVLTSGQAIVDPQGRKLGAVVAALDITERKRAEQRLREQATLLEKAHDAIVIWDLNDIIVFWNAGAQRLYGWSSAEVLGKNAGTLLFARPSQQLAEALQQVVERGEWIGELEQVARDCRVLVVHSHWTLLRDDAGRPRAKLAINTDITEKKRLETQLLHAQRMESIGRLAGGVAHDFNNLLTVITGYSEMLLLRRAADDPATEPLRQIRKAGERAAGLTRQLLAFSRKQMLRAQVVNLNDLVRESEKMFRRLIGEDIDFASFLDPALGAVKADVGQLEQVLLNLIVNARDAMPRGGYITVETHNVDLDEAYAQQHPGVPPGPYVLLAITDTGCGMDETVRSQIFEPFFTTKEPGKGTGLGLATVFGVVKQSAGHLEVYSEVDHGTTFKIYLPRLEQEAPEQQRAETLKTPSGTETVLLAEDEESVRALARLALQSHGFAVVEARDGQEALVVCQRQDQTIHLLVTDVVMPKISGRQLVDQVLALRPGLKVLYLSGYTDDAVVRHGVVEAGVPFLQKPFTPTMLVRKVREVLDS